MSESLSLNPKILHKSEASSCTSVPELLCGGGSQSKETPWSSQAKNKACIAVSSTESFLQTRWEQGLPVFWLSLTPHTPQVKQLQDNCNTELSLATADVTVIVEFFSTGIISRILCCWKNRDKHSLFFLPWEWTPLCHNDTFLFRMEAVWLL